MTKYAFDDVVRFKQVLQQERQRFANAFAAHLLRYALARDLEPGDVVAVDEIVHAVEEHQFPMRSMIRELVLSDCFVQPAARNREAD